jgi:hypothetical protein
MLTGLALMTGCATTPTETVIPEPIQVKVPYPVPCKIAPVEKPSPWPMDTVSTKDNLLLKTQKALSEIELRRAYEIRLETAVKSCQ